MLRSLLLLLALLPLSVQAAEVAPFEAHYHLAIDGWPDADVSHSLAPDEDGWRSTMQASISIASGVEFSRFHLDSSGLATPWSFYSRYRLFGFGDDYRLDARQLSTARPDRQAALFDLSRLAFDSPACRGRSATPCQLDYVDHRERNKTLAWRVIDNPQMPVPAGAWATRHVEAWDIKRPERRLNFYFSPQHPGLLVQVDYFRDGKLRARMQLTDFSATSQRHNASQSS
ncbi:hypothetical protein [Kushneria aurantia]|uniref:DUF3108 domain-containing protein n=1 Tax=Kushneria aurantia TaxID=504092 RepID=A0ABV6G168_9GAMM|nr:hypothetical protein [Kushneria aurantia]